MVLIFRIRLQAAGCLLDNLLAARDDDGRGMSDLRLRDELMTLLVAGQETCGPAATHPCHCALSLNRYSWGRSTARHLASIFLGNRAISCSDMPFCWYSFLA